LQLKNGAIDVGDGELPFGENPPQTVDGCVPDLRSEVELLREAFKRIRAGSAAICRALSFLTSGGVRKVKSFPS
jgi:hypothetical protein